MRRARATCDAYARARSEPAEVEALADGLKRGPLSAAERTYLQTLACRRARAVLAASTAVQADPRAHEPESGSLFEKK